MTLFLENTDSINNYIHISNKIRNIPLFFIHFLPIMNVKNIDNDYQLIETEVVNDNKTTNVKMKGETKREIKYKIINYDKNINQDELCSYVFVEANFAKSIYHIFYSSSLLHKHDMSFVLGNSPFVGYQNNLPILHDFSHSFSFQDMDSLKPFFPRQFIQNIHTCSMNTYISIDVFIIAYLLHHNIEHVEAEELDKIVNDYTKDREKIDKKSTTHIVSYFCGYKSKQVIEYLFQFKYTWVYYSLCYYFVLHYPELLEHFSLYKIFYSYIHSTFTQRVCKDNDDILSTIHKQLFEGI